MPPQAHQLQAGMIVLVHTGKYRGKQAKIMKMCPKKAAVQIINQETSQPETKIIYLNHDALIDPSPCLKHTYDTYLRDHEFHDPPAGRTNKAQPSSSLPPRRSSISRADKLAYHRVRNTQLRASAEELIHQLAELGLNDAQSLEIVLNDAQTCIATDRTEGNNGNQRLS